MMTVKISRLTKVYGQGKNAVVALNEFDLEIAPNEVCIVRGPNGSGKSTLISILSGELEQTAGSISLSAKSGEAPVIAIIGQFHNLIDELTVAEHFALLGTNQNLDLVPSELLDQRCAELSRGQAQMVAIALALTTDVDVLLADEPTGALGADESEAIYDFIKRAAHQHQSSVLLVTHDIHADRIADRIVRLRDGRLSESWTFGNSEQQVISSTGWVRLPEAVVDGMNELVDIRDDEAGATIRGRQRPPLSDVHVSSKRPAGIEPVVTVSALETRYGKHVVGRDINVTALADELLCVVGKSGAGKTTLLKTLSGLHNDFAGEIQKPDVLPYFSSEHLFGSGLSLKEFGIQPNLVTALSLDELVTRRLDTLSGGQQQRALVAIALSSDHPVLLLDEPTSALDDVHAPAVIRAILESPKTIVAATHDERLIAVANQTIAL